MVVYNTDEVHVTDDDKGLQRGRC